MKSIAEILEKLGGHLVVASALNCAQSSLRNWKMNGKIPGHRFPDLIRLANERRVRLTYNDLVNAR